MVYRSLVRPLMQYIDEIDAHYDDDVLTVIVPEFIPSKWWQHPVVRGYLKIVAADAMGAARTIYTTWELGPIGWDAAAAAGLWSSVTMTLSLLF